jgi:hypothetical protein
MGVKVIVGVSVGVGVQLGVKVNVGRGVLVGSVVGVGACTRSLPTEQAKLAATITSSSDPSSPVCLVDRLVIPQPYFCVNKI